MCLYALNLVPSKMEGQMFEQRYVINALCFIFAVAVMGEITLVLNSEHLDKSLVWWTVDSCMAIATAAAGTIYTIVQRDRTKQNSSGR
jgi:hypothetical protein